MKSNIFIKMKEPKKLLTKNNYEVIARVVVRNGNFRKISFVKVSKIRTLSKKSFGKRGYHYQD